MSYSQLRLTAGEKWRYERDGYLLRERVFSADDIEDLRAVVEEVRARVIAHATREGAGPEQTLADGHRIQFSSHTAIQWEWREGSREIRLVEPFTHLHERFEALWNDPRLVQPMQDAVGVEEVGPFTSKLNLKRAREGSEFPFHQDFPYWYVAAQERAAEVATAVLFLDDATEANGAIRVIPGSHKRGPWPRDLDEPTRFLTDAKNVDLSTEVTAEAPAGSLLIFGAYLVHRSSPNRTDAHRRAILLSYQPAGRPILHELEFRRELVNELP